VRANCYRHSLVYTPAFFGKRTVPTSFNYTNTYNGEEIDNWNDAWSDGEYCDEYQEENFVEEAGIEYPDSDIEPDDHYDSDLEQETEQFQSTATTRKRNRIRDRRSEARPYSAEEIRMHEFMAKNIDTTPFQSDYDLEAAPDAPWIGAVNPLVKLDIQEVPKAATKPSPWTGGKSLVEILSEDEKLAKARKAELDLMAPYRKPQLRTQYCKYIWNQKENQLKPMRFRRCHCAMKPDYARTPQEKAHMRNFAHDPRELRPNICGFGLACTVANCTRIHRVLSNGCSCKATNILLCKCPKRLESRAEYTRRTGITPGAPQCKPVRPVKKIPKTFSLGSQIRYGFRKALRPPANYSNFSVRAPPKYIQERIQKRDADCARSRAGVLRQKLSN